MVKIDNSPGKLLGSEKSNSVKGLVAILILLHHIEQGFSEGVVFTRIGYLCVDVFMFLSGYGLTLSYTRKPNYLSKIVWQKVPTIVCWSLVCVGGMSAFFMITGERVTIVDVIQSIGGNRLLNWYFPACVVEYLLFCVVCKIQKGSIENRAVLLFGGFAIIAYFLCHMGILKIQWIYSIPAFPLGMIYFLHERRIDDLLRKSVLKSRLRVCSILATIIMLFIFVNFYLQTQKGVLFSLIYILGIWGTGLATTIICVIGAKQITAEPSIAFIGKHSAEMMLVQLLALAFFRNRIVYVQNDYFFLAGTIAIQTILLICIIPLFDGIRKAFERKDSI